MSTTAAPTDQRRRVLLPTDIPAIPPVTARLLRRAVAGYLVLWWLGLLLVLLDADEPWKAAGLGLAVPGGGLLYTGRPVLAAIAVLLLIVGVAVWWAAGPVVLPPLIWVATAGAAAALTTSPGHGAVAILAVGPIFIVASLLVHLLRHRSLVKRGVQLNDRLKDVEFVITGHPGSHPRTDVVEHSGEDLAHLRYALDIALQPLDSFEGLTKIDQFREAALRYQLNALSYSLSMAQFTRTPAFTGYLAEAQRNAIDKMQQRKVWGYWAIENAWGNLDLNRDPVENRDNIMLTGFEGLMIGMYATLNDDHFSQPGALTYRWDDRLGFPHDHGTLAASIHRNMNASPFTLFACEPSWIYTVCNTFGMSTLASHDRLRGTSYFSEVEQSLREAYEKEFLRPDGRIIGVRNNRLGLSWNFWAGASIQITTAYWMHATFPDLAQRAWWLLRENELATRDGGVRLPRGASTRLDPGNYQLGNDSYGLIVTTMAAREIGDDEWADAAWRTLTEREPVTETGGARRFREVSGLGNFYANLARFGRHSALRDLVAFGVPATWRTGPVLADVAYPDVQVARAVTDGAALDLVLRAGGEPVRTDLRIERLVPHRTYAVAGARDSEITASADGDALITIDLGDRLVVRLEPQL